MWSSHYAVGSVTTEHPSPYMVVIHGCNACSRKNISWLSDNVKQASRKIEDTVMLSLDVFDNLPFSVPISMMNNGWLPCSIMEDQLKRIDPIRSSHPCLAE